MPKLTINDGGMEGWYLIERAEHNGASGLKHMGDNCYAFWHAARFSDADVEGYAHEMLAIADAIEKRSYVSFKRCAVDARQEPVTFCSPRNSQVDGECSLAEADDLAKQIRAKCVA